MKQLLFLLLNIAFLMIIVQLTSSCQKSDYKQQLNPFIDKYVEAWNTGNLKELDAITSTEFVLRMTPDFKPKIGQELLKEEITNMRKAFPDFNLDVTEKLFVGDSAVVIKWNLTGTNTGESSMPATGSKVNISGFSVIFFSDNLITGEWIAFSDLMWVSQLGFTLTPPEFPEQ
ncbi:MAG: ester cyclase [Ignavibacteria bacterium]|nr:ester cyclase [Ignavibacteria bacterium]MBT8391282.1 ester cyclase [Ignavibacteria bacterium]